MRLPEEMSSGQTDILLHQDPEGLLREVAQLVAINPALADQSAFTSIVESFVRFVSPEARRALGGRCKPG